MRIPGLQSATHGAIAQLGERLLCKQEVAGSIPAGSTVKLGGDLAELQGVGAELGNGDYIFNRKGETTRRE
jgi:hypothetical protein